MSKTTLTCMLLFASNQYLFTFLFVPQTIFITFANKTLGTTFLIANPSTVDSLGYAAACYTRIRMCQFTFNDTMLAQHGGKQHARATIP